jgi:hypothetical protein
MVILMMKVVVNSLCQLFAYASYTAKCIYPSLFYALQATKLL